MPAPTEVDLTIHHVPYEVYSRLQGLAEARGLTVEEFVLQRATLAAEPTERPFDAAKWLEDVEKLRASIARRGPILNPGETVKDLARMGLSDA